MQKIRGFNVDHFHSHTRCIYLNAHGFMAQSINSKRAYLLPGHLLGIYLFILEKPLLEELTNAPPRGLGFLTNRLPPVPTRLQFPHRCPGVWEGLTDPLPLYKKSVENQVWTAGPPSRPGPRARFQQNPVQRHGSGVGIQYASLGRGSYIRL